MYNFGIHDDEPLFQGGFWGLVEGGVSMWGLKDVAWQPLLAFRNGCHTRHIHTPLSVMKVTLSGC